MLAEQVQVGAKVLNGQGGECHVWAVIRDRVYVFTRLDREAPWSFDRHAAAPSIDEFALAHEPFGELPLGDLPLGDPPNV